VSIPGSLKIGELEIYPPVMLAPMAGVSDQAFRLLCKEMGMGFCYTEFVSAEGIVRENAKTLEMMRFTEAERPIGIQIFGADPGVMAEAARITVETLSPDILDLNFGCPVPKVVKKGAGAALLKDMEHLARVAESVVRAVDIPVTIKMRSGWSSSSIVVTEAARLMEAAGVAAVTLHPRTADQGYRGKADWELIRQLKSAVNIPVIGNGDVNRASDALAMFGSTGCDAVMVGRGALGNPWIFRDLAALFQEPAGVPKGDHLAFPGIEERFAMILRHLNMLTEDYGEQGHKVFKTHFAWYSGGLPGAAKARSAVNSSHSSGEMTAHIMEYRDELTTSG